MLFVNVKKYYVDVKQTLEAAKIPDDLYPDTFGVGVSIASLRGLPEFSDCEDVVLFYNLANNKVTVDLVREQYKAIDVAISDKEIKLLADFFFGK